MPRGKTIGYKLRGQVKKAIFYLDKMLDHLMAADVVAKGGTIDGVGKFVPADVDMKNPSSAGHPVMNQYLPFVLEISAALKEALKNMSMKL